MSSDQQTGLGAVQSAESRKPRTGLVTILFTDMVGSMALKQQLGDQGGVALFRKHHQQVRELLAWFPTGQEIETAGDSFLIIFSIPSDAVRFALLLQSKLRHLREEARVSLFDRVGIHVGEVVVQGDQSGSNPREIYGIQIDTCSRVMSLAKGGQVLMSRGAFDSARQVLKGEDIEGVGQLEWLSHGPYLLKGLEEAVEICEVREAGKEAPGPPTSSEKAQRKVSADEEPVLGWRPAIGQRVSITQWILEKKLGEGGFGEVWLGRHERMKERRVFKFCFRADRVRFLKREMTLFRLLKERIGNHPNIVALREVYFTDPPFYVEMDYVEGADLRSWCEEQGGINSIPLETRLEIVAQTADGLQAAHEAGIIHRDIKPGNILVQRSSRREEAHTSSGGDVGWRKNEPPDAGGYGVLVKLTDFGIGQVVSEECLKGITRAGFTQTIVGGSSSSHTGTQLYMAPELLAGKPASTRSDIYSLGVVLYQLLVGDFTRPITTDWARDINDPLLREDLQLCFAGNPQDRFAGAGQLAKGLRSLEVRRAARLERERAERASQWRRRISALASGIALALLALSLALGYGLRRAWRSDLEARQSLYAANMNLAQAALESGNTRRALDLLEPYSRPDQTQAPGFEWRYLRRLADGNSRLTLQTGVTNIYKAVVFSPDGRTLAIGSATNVQLREMPSGRSVGALKGHRLPVRSLAFSPDGHLLASEDAAGAIILWNFETHKQMASLEGNRSTAPASEHDNDQPLVFFPDGKRLAMSGGETVKLRNIAAEQEPPEFIRHDSAVVSLGISSDGKMLALGDFTGTVELWDVESHRSIGLLTNHYGRVNGVAFSPDGKTLAAASYGNEVKLWDLETQRTIGSLMHAGSGDVVAFSRDGNLVATGSGDQTAKLWNSRTRRLLKTFKGHTGTVDSLAFSPDGSTLATHSVDGTVRLWDTTASEEKDVLRHDDAVVTLAFSPDGKMLATGGRDGTLTLWNVTTQRRITKLPRQKKWIWAVGFSRDSRLVASGSGDWFRSDDPGELKVWDITAQRQIANLVGHQGCVFSVDFLPDGKSLVSGSNDQTLRLWDIATRRQLTNVASGAMNPGWLYFGALSPDGQTLVSCGFQKNTTLWEIPSLKKLRTIETNGVGCAAFSPNGRILATGGDAIELWDMIRRKRDFVLPGQPFFGGVALAPDGRRLASACNDGTVILWNLASRHEVLTLRGHSNQVTKVAFSPDGKTLASASIDKTVRLWRTDRAEETDKTGQ